VTSEDRYYLNAFSDGAVLFDLQSGTIFQLNASATLVWRLKLAGYAPEAVAQSLAAEFDIQHAEALEDVNTTLAIPHSPGLPVALPGNCRYERGTGDDYRLIIDNREVLEIREEGPRLRKKCALAAHKLDLYLRIIAPKIISLSGSSVWHASAVERPDGTAVAFLGKSGAGKTTTARSFGRAGWRILCEDKMVVNEDEGRLCAVADAESQITNWVVKARGGLAAAGIDEWYDAEALGRLATGRMLSLTDFVILDAERRKGSTLELQPLGHASSAVAIFQHSFFGSAVPERWRHHIDIASKLARQATTFRATVPAGLDALEIEAKRYVTSKTS